MLGVIWGSARKDIRSALTERSTLVQSITLPVNYLIMMSLFVLAGSHAPTAVVMYDHGPYARQFVTTMIGLSAGRYQRTPSRVSSRSLLWQTTKAVLEKKACKFTSSSAFRI